MKLLTETGREAGEKRSTGEEGEGAKAPFFDSGVLVVAIKKAASKAAFFISTWGGCCGLIPSILETDRRLRLLRKPKPPVGQKEGPTAPLDRQCHHMLLPCFRRSGGSAACFGPLTPISPPSDAVPSSMTGGREKRDGMRPVEVISGAFWDFS